MRRGLYVAGAGLLAVVVLGACSHPAARTSGGAGVPNGNGAVFGRAVPAAPAAPSGTAPAPALGARAGIAAAGSGQVVERSALRLDTGSRILVAELTVAIKGARNVAGMADRADDIATRIGGEVDRDDRTSGSQARATLQLRVPPDSLMSTLSALAKLGVEKYRQVSSTDVTQKVADVGARVLSAQASINQLNLLFHRAQKVGDVIRIEGELSQREADLESLQAQQRALDRETSLATITLTLVTAAKKAATHKATAKKKRGGFVGGLQRGWDGFTAAAAWVADAIGTLLPFLLLAAALTYAGRLAWTHRRPRRPATE